MKSRAQWIITLILSVLYGGYWYLLITNESGRSLEAQRIAIVCAIAAGLMFVVMNAVWLMLRLVFKAIGAVWKALFAGESLPDAQHIRGRQITDYEFVAQKAIGETDQDDPGLMWGGVRLPSHYATQHFLVAGVPGSGKTLTIQMLMASALPLVGKGLGHRAFIYDAKRDVLAVLAGMGLYDQYDPNSPTAILNPFDARSAAWDMAADITNEKEAHAVANILFPEEKNANNPFFSKAASALAGGVMTAFAYHAPGKWTFRDVILALQSTETMRRLFQSYHQTSFLAENHLTNRDVQGTVGNDVVLFKPIAAAWSHAKRKISLRAWEEGEGILVMGTDASAAPQLAAVNRVIFHRASQLLLTRDDYSARNKRSWMFLDECQLAKLEGEPLAHLLEGGRSKGVAVVLGFQDIQGMRTVYGETQADSLISQCGNKAILRTDGEKSSQWAAALVGQYDRQEYQTSYSSAESRGGNSNSTSHALTRVQRDAIMPSQFMELQTPDFRTGRAFDGVYLTRIGGVHRLSITPDYMLRYALPEPDRTVPDFVPRPTSELELAPWTAEDLKRLNLTADVLNIASSTPETVASQSAKPAAPKSSLSQIKRLTQ